MKFRFLIAAIFALFSVLLLIEEGKEVKFTNYENLDAEIFDSDSLKQSNASERLLFTKSFVKRYSSGYQVKNESVSEENIQIQILFCLPLKTIFRNKNELDLDQTSGDLVKFFNRTFYAIHLPARNSGQIGANETFIRKLKQFDRSIMKPLKSRNYYLVRNRFCLILPLFYSARPLLNDLFKGGSYYFFAKNAYTFIQLRPRAALRLSLFLNEENPNFDCLSNTRFECLNDCLKGQVKLFKHFFRGNETGIIHSDYENKTALRNHERNCFRRCEKNFCILSKLTAEKATTSSLSVVTLRATPSISPFNYWIQMVGLVLSFLGTSALTLAVKPFHILLRENRKKLLWVSKTLMALLCLVAFLVLTKKFLSDFLAERKGLNFKISSYYLFKPESLNLVVCVPVIHILNHYKETINQTNNETINKIDLPSQQFKLNGLNFSELESQTDDAFAETVHEIYLETLGRRSEVSYKLLDKVLFLLEAKSSLFSRCFQLTVKMDEPRYRSFLQASKLTIIMKHPLYSLYLLTEGQNFHSAVHPHDKRNKYKKVVFSFPSEIGCRDYRLERLEGRSKCDTFANCADQCAQEEAIKQKRNLSVYGLIEKEMFSDDQWSGLFPDFSKEAEQMYRKAKSECYKVFRTDCDLIYFEKVELITDFSPNQTVMNVQISYVTVSYSVEFLPVLKLIFDLVTVQGILFDLNVLQLLIAAVLFIKRKCNWKRRNVYLSPIYLLSCSGFLLHLWILFKQVQNDQLVLNTHLDPVNSVNASEIFFCFDFDHSLDPNVQLTGNHLEEVTKNMTIESVFESIHYRTNTTIPQRFLGNPIHLNRLADNVTYNFSLQQLEQLNLDKFFFLRFESFEGLFWSWFQERDVHSYLANLKAKFKRLHNATTTELLLERGEFDLQINDTLFREFYERVQHPKDRHTPAKFIYDRQMFDSVLQIGNAFGNHLVFCIHFYAGKNTYRSENNLAKFILSLLNAFNLWLGLNVWSTFAFRFKLCARAACIAKIRHQILRFFSTGPKIFSKLDSESLPNISATVINEDPRRGSV